MFYACFKYITKNQLIMKALLLSLFVLIAMGCSSEDNVAATFEPQNITPAMVGKGVLANTQRFAVENRVITTNAQWQEVLTQMRESREDITDIFAETAIDFSQYQIIASYIISSSGTTIDVTSVVENEDNITVTLENLRQGATQDVTHPFNIIKIPRSPKPIIFEYLTEGN